MENYYLYQRINSFKSNRQVGKIVNSQIIIIAEVYILCRVVGTKIRTWEKELPCGT